MTSRIWTAAELEQMTPAERRANFDASIITNLDDAPPELLQRARERLTRIIADEDADTNSSS